MNDVNSLVELMEQGDLASLVLDNAVFRKVADELNRDYGKAFKGDDMEAALKARDEARALESLLTKLTRVQSKGQRAAEQLQELRDRKEAGLPIDATALNGVA